jgi:hypothetical protein
MASKNSQFSRNQASKMGNCAQKNDVLEIYRASKQQQVSSHAPANLSQSFGNRKLRQID